MVEDIPSESTEMEYQSGRNSSRIYQEEQETAVALEYETRVIHVDKDAMDIYMELFISRPAGKGKCLLSSYPMNWVQLWTG